MFTFLSDLNMRSNCSLFGNVMLGFSIKATSLIVCRAVKVSMLSVKTGMEDL